MNSTDSTDSTGPIKWKNEEIDEYMDPTYCEEYLRKHFVESGLMPANSNQHVCDVPCVNATLPEAEAAEAALKDAKAAEKAKSAKAAAEKAEEAKTAKAAEEAEEAEED